MDLKKIEALERLAELNRQGFLTDAEVAVEKNQILSSEVPTVDESGTSHEPHPTLIDIPARLRELREKAEAESKDEANDGPQPLHPTAETESEENQILSSEVPTVDESGSSHEPHSTLSSGVPSASGHNGQISFDGDFLVISRKGLLAKVYQGAKGDKRVPLTSITSVQLREPKFGTDGYIQFGLLGSIDSGGGMMAARHDENSVSFYKKDLANFQAVRSYVEQQISERSKPQVVVVGNEGTDVATQLQKLAGLKEQGLLTQEEFDSQKAKLLSS